MREKPTVGNQLHCEVDRRRCRRRRHRQEHHNRPTSNLWGNHMYQTVTVQIEQTIDWTRAGRPRVQS